MEFSELSDVSFPEMRRSVLSAVLALSDEAYQRRVWIGRQYPQEGYYDDFTMNANILFDDTLVLENPASTLGTILECEEEVEVMAALAAAINDLIDSEGGQKTDAEYIVSPLWRTVVRSAAKAYDVMTR
ncbi:hypothetical protein ABZU45_24885 [Streptomyces avermitilis]|uniref:SCO4402 family protein n=1 Tax=Streptomyces avermitilis TaxID=33903 RepID=UPI0033B7097F